MRSTHITVVYKWTAKPGKLDELKSIYEQVTEVMNQNEPDAQAVHCYASEKDNALYVRDEFKDAAALGLHLSSTAASHFPQLLAIAVPGPFFFHGDVPEELKQATEQMQLGAEFATHAFGFDR
jgi:quinol monooxygenase YgiN